MRRKLMRGTRSEGAMVVTVTVKGDAEPLGMIGVDETVQVDKLGAPVQASATGLEKPLSGDTCRLKVAGEPAVTVAEVEPPGAAARAKSVAVLVTVMVLWLLAAVAVLVRVP